MRLRRSYICLLAVVAGYQLLAEDQTGGGAAEFPHPNSPETQKKKKKKMGKSRRSKEPFITARRIFAKQMPS